MSDIAQCMVQRIAKLEVENAALAVLNRDLTEIVRIRGERLAEAEMRIAAVVAMCAGEAEPRWPNDMRVTEMRGRILDVCQWPSRSAARAADSAPLSTEVGLVAQPATSNAPDAVGSDAPVEAGKQMERSTDAASTGFDSPASANPSRAAASAPADPMLKEIDDVVRGLGAALSAPAVHCPDCTDPDCAEGCAYSDDDEG